MDFQRLPLPVGSAHPVRVARPRRLRPARSWGSTAVLSSAMAAALAGAALGASPAPNQVSLDASGYTVAGVTLPARGEGVYSGPAGAVVIFGSHAAASTTLDGRHMRGMCEMAHDARTERCQFELGGSRFSSTDVMRGGGWDRSYQDGTNARIDLAMGRPVPVPFALGR